MDSKVAFDSVCAKVAERYADKGWRYAKSSHWMTKKDKDFTFKVLFYTSWGNISDVSVTFYGSFAIYSTKTKRCFTATCSQDYKPNGELDWNIASEDSWDKTVDEFTEWLDKTGMPMMDECLNNLDEFVKRVAKEGFYPWKGYIVNMDFILQFGTPELAEEAARKCYESENENVRAEFRESYESLMSGGDAANGYGRFQMLNPSNFRTIIENKVKIDFGD